MSQWSSGSESGILRKNKPKENFDDLLVFGYACKIFRDDEKALIIDQGKHLIPWMGDGNVKIDRYDCRGFLSDLKNFEASREGFDTMRWLGLNENDRKIEHLCDEERYYSLKINEEEEKMYREEEIKRSKTNEFQYNYDVPVNPETQEGVPTVPEADEEEEEYKQSPELDVPVDIAIPKTVKEFKRIEKTAFFVAQQGPQMEILIKAKQADNPNFSFLNQQDTLNKFYKHVLMAIKSGHLRLKSPHMENETRKSESESGDEHYLHPSLISSGSAEAAPPVFAVPNIAYKPSEDCAYSRLVNKIQGSQGQDQSAVGQAHTETQTRDPYAGMTYEQQQYYQYYVTQHYYEYYNQYIQQHYGDQPTQEIDPSVQAYIQQMFYAQYMQHQAPQPTNPYAQIVSNVNKDKISHCQENDIDISKEPVIYSDPSKVSMVVGNKPVQIDNESSETVSMKPSLLSLMQHYGSSDNSDEEDIKEPTGDLKIVIDKMALYVAKNGSEFENIVRSRNDPRFEFLKENDDYYPYYKKRSKELVKNNEKMEENLLTNENSPETENDKLTPKGNDNIGENKTTKFKENKIAPVCFSIKKQKEETVMELKSALPMEESTEEEEEEHPPPAVPSATAPVISSPKLAAAETAQPTSETVVLSPTIKQETILVETKNDDIFPEITTANHDNVSNDSKSDSELSHNVNGNGSDDPILEMIDLTDENEQKSNEPNRVALQLERKRKALEFLRMQHANAADANIGSPILIDDKTSTDSLSDATTTSKKRSRKDSAERKRKRLKKRDRDKRSRKKDRQRKSRSRSRRDSDPDDAEFEYAVRSKKTLHKKKKSHSRKRSKSKYCSSGRKKLKKKHLSESSGSSSEECSHR